MTVVRDGIGTMKSDAAKKELLHRGQHIALISSLITLGVALVKGVVGYGFNSHLLLADALHSAGDVVTIAASGFGLWLAARNKSATFPYGLYRAETVASLFIGVLIVVAGIELVQDGYRKFFVDPVLGGFPLMPCIAALISLLANWYLAGRQHVVGQAINSQSLMVKARDTQLDSAISAAVLGGILLAYWQVPYVEGGLILLIALFVLKLGVETIWLSILSLLDANLDPELQEAINREIASIQGVRKVSLVRVRRAGPFRMVECTIETSPNLSLYKAHELADQVEEAILAAHGEVDSIFVHVEPYRGVTRTVLIPVTAVNGLESIIHDHFGRAPYFVLVSFDESRIAVEDFYLNEFLDEKLHIGVKIIKAIAGSGFDLLFTCKIGELAFSLLQERYVDMYRVDGRVTVLELVTAFREGRLARLLRPTHSLDDSETGRLAESSGSEDRSLDNKDNKGEP